MKKQKTPEHLSPKAKEIYIYFTSRSRTPGQIALLLQGLEMMDTATECGKIIAKDGVSSVSERSGLVHQHTLLKTKQSATASMLKIFVTLGLDQNPNEWAEI